jgi:hypothetical protein
MLVKATPRNNIRKSIISLTNPYYYWILVRTLGRFHVTSAVFAASWKDSIRRLSDEGKHVVAWQ